MTVEYNILFFKKYVVLPDTTNRIETSWRSIVLFLFLFELFFFGQHLSNYLLSKLATVCACVCGLMLLSDNRGLFSSLV